VPPGKTAADIKEKATNAYRVAELRIKAERKVEQETA